MNHGPLVATTLSTLLRQRATQQPDAAALLAPGRPALTYAQLWHQVRHVAATLQAHGATPATRVAVVLPNGPEMAGTFLGVAASAACAPLNPAYQAGELRFYLEDTQARVVVVGKTERGPIRAVATELGLEILEIEADASARAGQARPAPVSSDAAGEPVFAEANAVALVLHTSGTTGRPKRVALSHANLLASAHHIAQTLALEPADRCLNVMPLFHIHGLVGALLASLAGGGSVVCTPGFDEHAFFDWVARFEPTWYTAVPTIHQAVLAQGARYRQVAAQHRFRFVRSSSSALPPTTLAALEALTGAPVVEAYGMTEASHQMACNPLAGPRKPGSVGPASGVEIALLDATGHALPAGATGEVAVRGPGVMGGYENAPNANAEAFVDGWFRTGDQGHLDADGYLYLTGRLKEIVNRGGEKVSPREVDEALLEHPDVQQAAAFATPHPSLGEDLAAAVVLRHGAQADESRLRRFLLDRLAGFKVPSRIIFVDTIAAGATGKIQRARLYGRFAARLETAFEAPQTDLEHTLAQIFRDVLGGPPVGRNDNFFALGGDSLKGAQVVARIRAQQSVQLPVTALFAHPSVATLALAFEAARASTPLDAAALEAQIAAMSDEEVARLLAQEEAASGWTPR